MAEAELAAAGDGQVVMSDDYPGRAKRIGMVGLPPGALVLPAVFVFLMVTKPGA